MRATSSGRAAGPGIDVVPDVVAQHLEDAASLRLLRRVRVRAADAFLSDLRRLDGRLTAHLDGLSIAGDAGWMMAQRALESPNAGTLFVAMVLALQRRDEAAMERLISLVGVVADARSSLASAFGWNSTASLRGLVPRLLASNIGTLRAMGLEACRQHRVDSGKALVAALCDPDPLVRRCGLRAAGECGRVDLAPPVSECLNDADRACRFHSARSAALLGDRGKAQESLDALAVATGKNQAEALALSILIAPLDSARDKVRRLKAAGASMHLVVRAVGWTGDSSAIPWLLELMLEERFSRVAAEAFVSVTGADLNALGLVAAPRDATPHELTDESEATWDASLPWPDATKLIAWWRTTPIPLPSGTPFFFGAGRTSGQCARILRDGSQRQRLCAAVVRTTLEPGTSLFNASAPVWRQDREIAPVGLPGA